MIPRERTILDRHFEAWRAAGLITPELEARMRQASVELQQRKAGGLVMKALGALGGALLLTGLILIVAENWDALPRVVKLGAWAALQFALLAGAHRMGHARQIAVAEGLALAGSGWVLAGIALVSQIYQLSSRDPNGVWLWLALIVPVAWVLPRRSVTVSVFAALVAALLLEVNEADSWIKAADSEGPWLWMAVPLLAAVLVSWLPTRVHALQAWTGTWVFGVITIAMLVLGATHDADSSVLGAAWWVVAPALLAALVWPDRCLPRSWDAATCRIVIVTGLLPWVVMGRDFDPGMKDTFAVGLAWVLQIGIAVVVIRAGARAGADAWVNIGYLALLAGVLTRYFDFFGNYLEGGAALLLTGVLLLFILYALNRARQRTLAGEEG
ncbi:MAG: DUF2157 domain-containing protein [Vicinamibacterales bacterium]